MKAKKAKAEKRSKAKVTEEKKPEAKDLPEREILEGVTAIVLKKGKLEINSRQCVYQTENAVCVWGRDARKRIHWLPRRRVVEIER